MTSFGLNLYKIVSLYKNCKHEVNPKFQGVTCPVATSEPWNAYNTDTKANPEKRLKKMEQKLGKR